MIGPSGLVMLKNLRDEGFNVTVFERRDSVGGVWSFSDDPETTSTLPGEISASQNTRRRLIEQQLCLT